MSEQLKNSLEDFLRASIKSENKKPTLEEVFQKTLDCTTPSQPGDIRNLREHDKPKVEEWF